MAAQAAHERAPGTAALLLADDGDLAGRCAEGNRQAFAVLMTRHRELMYALCLRVTGSREDALDALQEALIRVWRGLGGYRRQARFTTWLYRVTVNAALEEVARRSRAPEPVGAAVSEQALADSARGSGTRSPEDIVAARLTVDAALQLLPPAYRAAVVLREVAGCSYEEIAEVLDIPPGTVRSRVARGRQGLLSLLSEPAGR